jgi:hypothetical protein
VRFKAFFFVAALLPLWASAQGQAAAPIPDDPRAPRFREIERGAFVGFESGGLLLLKTPTADAKKFPFTQGDGGVGVLALVGVHVGYDITDRLSASLFTLGANGSASATYGSFSVLATGGDLRLAFLGWNDGQGVERYHLYVHGRGGWLVTRPTGLLGDKDVLVSGGPGFEYFTHLRHFSVALGLDAAYLTKAKVFGLTGSAAVRYTF